MTLRTAKKDIEATHTGVKVLAFVADATDRIAVTSAISAVEKVNTLIQNTGYL